jgi:hypothetical protein
LAHLTPRAPADTIGAHTSQLKSSNYFGLSGSSWRRSKLPAGGERVGKTRVFPADDIGVRSDAPSRREWSVRRITQEQEQMEKREADPESLFSPLSPVESVPQKIIATQQTDEFKTEKLRTEK